MANLDKDYYLDEQGLQTLINELETNLVALEYSSSATYAVGDYCVHDNKMYRCTTVISTAEAWNSAHWSLVIIGDELKTKKSGTVTSVTIKGTSPIVSSSESAITTSGTRTISHANSGVTAGTYKSVTVNATGHVTAGSNPTTLSGYGITDAKIESGIITLGSDTITPLTSHQTVTDGNPTLDWSTQSTVATIGSTDIHVTMPANPNTDTKVRQTLIATNYNRPLLMSSAQTSSETANIDNVTYRNNSIFANPSTGRITTKNLTVGISADNATFPDGAIRCYDVRNVTGVPTTEGVNFIMTNEGSPINTNWYSGLYVKSSGGEYGAWELIGPAYQTDNRTKPFYVRASNKIAEWGAWRKLYDSSNPPTYSEVGAAPTSHAHGNIASGGTISSSAVTPASGDYLLISDTSASEKIERGIALGTSTTTYLTNKGTWATPVGTTYTGTSPISVNSSTHDISLSTVPIANGGTGGTTKLEATDNLSVLYGTAGGTLLVADQDCDSLTVGKTYYSSDSTLSDDLVNPPTTDSGFKIFTLGTYSSNYPAQIAIGPSANVWIRGKYKDGSNYPWNAWAWVYTSTNLTSRSAASGGTAVSLVTTGEKYTWNNKVNKSGDTMTGNLTIKVTSTHDDNSPSKLILQTVDSTNNVTSTGYIAAYDGGANGANIVIHPGGNLFLGSGEAAYNHYNSAYTHSITEAMFITSDNQIHIQANGQTIANRVGVQIDTSGNLVPEKADVATTNIGGIGTSTYKWADGYFTNINGVTVGDSPKFTDTTYTASSTNTTSKIFLVGTISQTTGTNSARTYSNVNCYASGGKLYSNGSEVALKTDIPSSATSSTTGISIADHTTTTIYGVKSSTTTASKVTLGTSFTVPNVTSAGSASTWVFEDITVPKAASSATSIPNVTGVGEGDFTATVTNGVLSFSHTHEPPTLGNTISVTGVSGSTTASHVKSGGNGTKPTLGTSFTIPNVTGNSDVTVPIKNDSTTTVVTTKTHSITDNGHTHTLS